VKIEKHESLDESNRYVATFGRSNRLDINRGTLLAITDTETGSYTCLDDLAGTFYERRITAALGRQKHGEEMPDPEPVEDRYHSETELKIIADGLEPGEDPLVEENGVEGAFQMLEAGHPESHQPQTPDSVIAKKRMEREDYM
jgi:hypothetical protein